MKNLTITQSILRKLEPGTNDILVFGVSERIWSLVIAPNLRRYAYVVVLQVGKGRILKEQKEPETFLRVLIRNKLKGEL